MPLLDIKNLSVEVEGKRVIEGLAARVIEGEVVLLTGPNGSGKSSLANTLLGSKQWTVTRGQVMFEGRDLLAMTPDERARAGVMVAWQTPVTIPGVSVFTLCKAALSARGNKIGSVVEFKRKLDTLALRVGLTAEHIGRAINEGFSGGERKRLELLQLLLLEPRLVVLDEIDSGLDEGGRRMVGEVVQEQKARGCAVIVISHYKDLLDPALIDTRWEMRRGRLQTGV